VATEPTPSPNESNSAGEGIGCGVFLVLAGMLLLAEQMGWIKNTSWLFPVILIAWGAGSIFQALRKR
jgi:hypothetical protein